MAARRKPTRRSRARKRRAAWPGRLAACLVAATVAGAGLWYGLDRNGASAPAGRAPDRVATADPTPSTPIHRPTRPPTPAPPAVVTPSPSQEAATASREPSPEPIPDAPAREPAATPPAVPDLPTWLRHAAAAGPTRGRPMIAVVIDDLGVDRRRSGLVAELPGPLTLAWLPYARDLPRQTATARAAGHELMVHLPMEPTGAADPGPGAMLTELPVDELRRRIDAGLAAFDGYVGVNNHMGSRFTEDRAGMSVVLGEIGRRGLMFLDSRTSGRSVGYALAREMRMPAAARDVFIDHDPAPAAVLASLKRLEDVATRQGHAIGIGHPYDVTIDALKDWLPGIEARGFALVPVSAIVRSRGGPGVPGAKAGPS